MEHDNILPHLDQTLLSLLKENKGHRFKYQGDFEVILVYYDHDGTYISDDLKYVPQDKNSVKGMDDSKRDIEGVYLLEIHDSEN